MIGTNPFALAAPDGQGGAALVIDQSVSVVAKSEIVLRHKNGQKIDPTWAFDADGNPTDDPWGGLKGNHGAKRRI